MRKFFAKVMPCIAHKTAHRKVLWCFGCRLFFFGLHHLLTALPYLGISAVCSTSLVCNSRTQIIIHELDTHSNWLTVWFACSSYAYGKIHVVLKVENQQKKSSKVIIIMRSYKINEIVEILNLLMLHMLEKSILCLNPINLQWNWTKFDLFLIRWKKKCRIINGIINQWIKHERLACSNQKV